MYGSEQLNILTSFYGMPHTISFKSTTGTSIPDVDPEQTEAEWKMFRRLMFTKYKSSTAKDVTHALTLHIILLFPLLFQTLSPWPRLFPFYQWLQQL